MTTRPSHLLAIEAKYRGEKGTSKRKDYNQMKKLQMRQRRKEQRLARLEEARKK